MNKLEVFFKKLNPLAISPTYAKYGDAGLDITPIQIEKVMGENNLGEVFHQLKIKTGLAFEIPEGYVGLLFPRSSIKNYKARLSNSVGVIDSGYRGEITAYLDIPEANSEFYKDNIPVLQLIIIPYPQILLKETNILSETERGEGGFGSSGK